MSTNKIHVAIGSNNGYGKCALNAFRGEDKILDSLIGESKFYSAINVSKRFIDRIAEGAMDFYLTEKQYEKFLSNIQ